MVKVVLPSSVNFQHPNHQVRMLIGIKANFNFPKGPTHVDDQITFRKSSEGQNYSKLKVRSDRPKWYAYEAENEKRQNSPAFSTKSSSSLTRGESVLPLTKNDLPDSASLSLQTRWNLIMALDHYMRPSCEQTCGKDIYVSQWQKEDAITLGRGQLT
ncbi:unnamed protein product [Protopolystoma xenopodis]|uniref:Uncharacterized protein n=1 Tax=Protopolystoma xenopodis TaxID=117903 RepID=A0A3S5AAL9_9PLAT|nr:unnamed protein product [Protopolystoma xenopodis]